MLCWVVPTSLREDEREALAEIRYAIEEIVIPRCQPCELLPRLPNVIEMQVRMSRESVSVQIHHAMC